ncbi:MAG: hypothetical protein HY954_09955 [Deltaproteobacteria bacterium]|nr:hypothetical protein [Deltaproteobacteria bacterium]
MVRLSGVERYRAVSLLKVFGLFFIFISVLASGCAAKKNAQHKESYFESLNKWTRGIKIYEGLETRLYINATYKDTAFREAYIERYAASYELEEGQIRSLKERELEQAEKINEFFFTAYTPKDELNDFNDPSSVWKLYMEDDTGARLVPLSISRLDSTDPILREFFPYFDPWSSAYLVKFPKYSETGTEPIPNPGTKAIRLVVTGIFGKGGLEWRMHE